MKKGLHGTKSPLPATRPFNPSGNIYNDGSDNNQLAHEDGDSFNHKQFDTNNMTFQHVEHPKQKPVNKNKFHKIGTMMGSNIRKISVMQNDRRGTQFKNPNTQEIVENLSPFMINTNMGNRLRQNVRSPEPDSNNAFRAFSPFNVSELDEEALSDNDSDREGYKTYNENKLLSQFQGGRKAVSPMLRPSDKNILNKNNQENYDTGIRYKSPLPGHKPLPLINQENMFSTPLLGSKPPIRGNSRNEGHMKANGKQASTMRKNYYRNAKTKFRTLETENNYPEANTTYQKVPLFQNSPNYKIGGNVTLKPSPGPLEIRNLKNRDKAWENDSNPNTNTPSIHK